MSGIKYLFDTNVILGMYRKDAAILQLCATKAITLPECAYSAITRMELLGFPGITLEEERAIHNLLERMTHLSLTPMIEDLTIQIRRQHRLKLPDAIIAATAKAHSLALLTLDKELAAKAV
ncbi:type II toxin-antitoxin system VapC family toxin [Candidatus Methylomicrobium oryzae]|jgi:predicted nucleic acid-binding protein|uniref:type II toxin-antitoxin system VapC family toxin n=1 Tax=Candidatus Methylomicrobium oryzae TaxID=2802053 RepID=UPI001922973E|nr:type II toxin-antitoxin system VapC family toxin [Methylomicrobium sp. RS1]MBL1264518.1 type II toxin-antitoxin system VapC family toxin [Methylomicrobium sp. RS1]